MGDARITTVILIIEETMVHNSYMTFFAGDWSVFTSQGKSCASVFEAWGWFPAVHIVARQALPLELAAMFILMASETF
jgi:hypothetical protein